MDKDKIKKDYFKHFDVWRYQGKKIIRYRLLEAIKSSKYCIISSDVFNSPIEIENVKLFENYFYDAIGDIETIMNCQFFNNIEDAIMAFEEEYI